MRRTAFVAAALTLALACGHGGGDAAPAPTYRKDIAPIVASQCASCHRPGGIAPFSLLTYEDAVAHAAAMKQATAARTMPPFNLDNSGACHTYKDARWLDDAQIATIGAWVDAGSPEGDGPHDAITPPPPRGLDRVDLTIPMPAAYTPKTTGEDDYRCFVIDPKLAEDRFVTGFDSRPGAPRMVHHWTLFAFDSEDDEKQAEKLDGADGQPGYTCFGDTIAPSRWLVGSGPGGGALTFPEGTGLRMSAGRKTVLQMHYNLRNGTFADRTAIDLRLEPHVRTEAFVGRVADLNLKLPPRAASVDQSAGMTLENDSTLWGVWPHMHNLGSRLKVTATHGAQEQCVAQVNRWEFHWQGFANYATPIALSAGDSLRITCTYDTMGRDAVVGWGERTVDEMCIAFFYVTEDGRPSDAGQ